jgi:hypothetical protein
MNGKFSKWNKRITAWLLLIAGFYMGIMEYSIEYVLMFLGSGLAAIGLSIWQSVRSFKAPEIPPEDKDQKP